MRLIGHFGRHRYAILAGLVVGVAAVILPLAPWSGADAGPGGCPAHDQLVVASGTDVSLDGERRALIEKWNEQNRDDPGAQAKLVEISSLADVQRSQMAATAQSHSCDYDVLTLDAPLTAEFAKAGSIKPFPLPHGWDDDFLTALKPTVSWQNKVYALPFNTDVGLLYYRTQAAGLLPTGWPDLFGKAQEMTRHGFGAGMTLQFADYEGGTVGALELIWGFGGQVTEDGRVVVGTARNRLAVQNALTALSGAFSGGHPAVEDAAKDSDEAASIRDFLAGKVAFMRNWPYVFRVLAADPHMRDAKGRLRFGVQPLPGPSVLGGQNLAISAYSKKQAQAARLIEFLTGPPSEGALFSCGGFAPTRASAYRAPQPCTGSSAKEQQISPAELELLGQQIQKAVSTARPRPETPSYQDFSEAFRRCVRTTVLTGTNIDYQKFNTLLQNAYTAHAHPPDSGNPCT